LQLEIRNQKYPFAVATDDKEAAEKIDDERENSY
jgi:hypothetical protein